MEGFVTELVRATVFTLISESSSEDSVLRILVFCSWCSGYVSRMQKAVRSSGKVRSN